MLWRTPVAWAAAQVSGQGSDSRQTDRSRGTCLSLHSGVRTYARRGPDGHWIYPAPRFSTPRTLTLIRPYSNHPSPVRLIGSEAPRAIVRFNCGARHRSRSERRDESSTRASDQCPCTCVLIAGTGPFDLPRLVRASHALGVVFAIAARRSPPGSTMQTMMSRCQAHRCRGRRCPSHVITWSLRVKTLGLRICLQISK